MQNSKNEKSATRWPESIKSRKIVKNSTTSTLIKNHLDPEDIHNLDLERLSIFNRYRGHYELDRSDHLRLFRHELTEAIKSGGFFTSISHNQGTSGVCAIQPLAWDSKHFGLPMSKMTLAATPESNEACLFNLVNESLNFAKHKHQALHISCEIDIDDYLCVNTLLKCGAEIMDIKREYRFPRQKKIRAPKFLSMVREYKPEDKNDIMNILRKSKFETRFSRDRYLDHEKTKQLYQIWIENLLDSNAEDRIALVMEKNGHVQSCGTIERTDLNYAGVNVQLMSGGIYISTIHATGNYYPIIYSLIEKASKISNTSQTCVSLNNHSATKVLEKMNLGTPSTRYSLRIAL